MSFLARLEIDGEEMSVLHCSFRFSKSVDTTGKPVSIPKGGLIKLTIESTGNTQLFDWMISTTQTKNGTITFFRRDASSKLKALEFSEAYCVDYFETYNHLGDFPMQVELLISAMEIKLNDSEFVNNWPV